MASRRRRKSKYVNTFVKPQAATAKAHGGMAAGMAENPVRKFRRGTGYLARQEDANPVRSVGFDRNSKSMENIRNTVGLLGEATEAFLPTVGKALTKGKLKRNLGAEAGFSTGAKGEVSAETGIGVGGGLNMNTDTRLPKLDLMFDEPIFSPPIAGGAGFAKGTKRVKGRMRKAKC